MRRTMLLGRLILVMVAGAAALACGGSSSETPPPLEPHPMNLHYSRAATRLGNEIEAPSASATVQGNQPVDVPENEVDDVVPAAPRTWGSDPPKKK